MNKNQIENELSKLPKIQLEPVLNSNEPKWLMIHYEQEVTTDTTRTIKEILENPQEAEYVPKFDVMEQGLWRCKKCNNIIQSLSGKPDYCDETQGGCNRTADFEPVTKVINTDLWKLPLWKDVPVEELNMMLTFQDFIDFLKRTIVFVEEIQYKIMGLWILSSWKFNNWTSLGMPFFVGLQDSGKSRCLEIISELGWRFMLSSNATFPAIVRATHYYNAGICLDEAHNKLTTMTEVGQNMIDFIKPGYRKGSKYLVADKEDQEKIISYNNFGFKALGGEKFLNDKAMMSRCIVFEMEKDQPIIDNLEEVQNEINQFKTIFLNYKYKTGKPPELPVDFPLKGRIREIFENIIRTAMHIGLETDDLVKFAQREEKERLEEFRDSIQFDILTIIKNQECNETLDDAPEIMYIKDIMDTLGWDGKSKGQKPQSLGYILRNMGLTTTHTRDGKVIRIADSKISRKLKYLYKRYGV